MLKDRDRYHDPVVPADDVVLFPLGLKGLEGFSGACVVSPVLVCVLWPDVVDLLNITNTSE